MTELDLLDKLRDISRDATLALKDRDLESAAESLTLLNETLAEAILRLRPKLW